MITHSRVSVKLIRRASNFNEEIILPRETAEYLFHSCNDIVFLRGVKQELAENKFLVAWEADRALRLLLISLDVEEDAEIRFEAATWLETVLQKEEIQTFIQNQF